MVPRLMACLITAPSMEDNMKHYSNLHREYLPMVRLYKVLGSLCGIDKIDSEYGTYKIHEVDCPECLKVLIIRKNDQIVKAIVNMELVVDRLNKVTK